MRDHAASLSAFLKCLYVGRGIVLRVRAHHFVRLSRVDDLLRHFAMDSNALC